MQRKEKCNFYTKKKLVMETVPEEVQMLNLLGKNFKVAIINTFREIKETVYKELKEIMTIMSHKMEIINKTNCEEKGGG